MTTEQDRWRARLSAYVEVWCEYALAGGVDEIGSAEFRRCLAAYVEAAPVDCICCHILAAANQPASACPHLWHRYGTRNGVPYYGCQACGATAERPDDTPPPLGV